MSPENLSGYSCTRATPRGPCLTKIAHACQDAPKTLQRPAQRQLPQRAQVTFKREDANLKEEESSEDESDDEEAHPQHDRYKEAGHDAACYQHKPGEPVWILYLQPQRPSANSGSNVHVPVDSDMAGYTPGRGT